MRAVVEAYKSGPNSRHDPYMAFLVRSGLLRLDEAPATMPSLPEGLNIDVPGLSRLWEQPAVTTPPATPPRRQEDDCEQDDPQPLPDFFDDVVDTQPANWSAAAAASSSAQAKPGGGADQSVPDPVAAADALRRELYAIGDNLVNGMENGDFTPTSHAKACGILKRTFHHITSEIDAARRGDGKLDGVASIAYNMNRGLEASKGASIQKTNQGKHNKRLKKPNST